MVCSSRLTVASVVCSPKMGSMGVDTGGGRVEPAGACSLVLLPISLADDVAISLATCGDIGGMYKLAGVLAGVLAGGLAGGGLVGLTSSRLGRATNLLLVAVVMLCTISRCIGRALAVRGRVAA